VVPEGITVTEAAAAPTAGMTALGALNATGLREGQSIVIIGATGGLGCFATQFAAALGAHVIATARPEARKWITWLGAAETTGYGADEITAQARGSCPAGVDVLLDLVGDRDLFDACATAVRDGGTALSVNFGAPPEPDPSARVHTSNYILMDGKQDLLARITDQIAAGRVTVPVWDRVRLHEVPVALDRLKAGASHRGKTLIQIDDPPGG
jgi:NADPH:quinone reductase